jgi:hypothetical protein
MRLEIINTNDTAPYGIGEIMYSETVASLNEGADAYQYWVQENIREGSSAPRGIISDGENEYDACTGDLL